jgi:polysaccharide chain length determinant protein (PEP-CTERM system associated)
MNIQNIKPQDLLVIAIRHKWLIVGSIIVSLGLAWLFLAVTPRIYRSNTLILVENQQIPENYVSAVVSGSVSERLTVIKQQVLSRAVMNKVIDDYSLLPKDGVTNEAREALTNALRKNITIEFKGQPGSMRIDAFTISFAHTSPETAMKVTAGLASQFVEENLKTREEQVAGTTEFLGNELDRAKASLDEQEHAIATFKRKFIGELPSQIDANLQTLNRLEREQTMLSESIRHRLDRKTALDKMISAYESIGLSSMESPREAMMNQDTPADLTGKGKPAGNNRPGGGDSLGLRLKELERNLASMSAEYKDTYPDMIVLKNEITHIKTQILEKQRLVQRNNSEEMEVSNAKSLGERKSTRTQASIDPYLNELKRERDETEIGLNSLKEQEKRLGEQIRLYQSRVERTPEREQELTVLQRDYENTKRNYQTLLDKQLNAKVSEELERKQKAGKFRIVDPANLPTQQEYPDPTRVLLAGLLLGCMAGYGGAFALEILKKGFSKVEDVESLLGLPVLASIPNFLVASGKGSIKYLTRKSEPRRQIKTATGKNQTALPHEVEAGKRSQGLLPLRQWTQDDDDSAQQHSSASAALRLDLSLIVKRAPMSPAAEQFRVAATRLVLSSSGQKSTVIVVTSAAPGEGKSTTVSNLGCVLADDLGKSTLLIDCDFKRPVLHVYNNVPPKPGLVEVIYGDAQLDDCLHCVGESSLRVLPAGRRDHQLVDLGKIPQINTFITALKNKFEFIILDAPPILPLADMNLLAAMADMLVVVIRVNSTPQEVVQRAIKSLQLSTRAGIILTASADVQVIEYPRAYYPTRRGAYHS